MLWIILLILLNYLVKIVLNTINYRHILKTQNTVPSGFEEKLTLEEHQKAAEYSKAKIQFANFSLFVNCFLLVGWLGFGVSYLDSFARSFSLGPILTGLLFFTLYSLIDGLLSLPLSWYSTFVIEEKFGFNKMTPKLFVIDLIKSLIIGSILGLGILASLLYLMDLPSLKNWWWLVAYFVVMTFQLLMLWIYPTVLAPLFNKFTPLDNEELKLRIEALSKKININFKDYFVMDASVRSTHGNAYFTGFGKNKRVVFFDTLLKSLDTDQTMAVLAHELGHMKLGHIKKMLITASIILLISFWVMYQVFNYPEFYALFKVEKSTYIGLWLFMQLVPIFTFWVTPINSWRSRRKEFEADDFAKEHESADSLIESLLILTRDNSSYVDPHPWYWRFYYSHPPIRVRMQHLKS